MPEGDVPAHLLSGTCRPSPKHAPQSAPRRSVRGWGSKSRYGGEDLLEQTGGLLASNVSVVVKRPYVRILAWLDVLILGN